MVVERLAAVQPCMHRGETYVAAGKAIGFKRVLYVSTREPHPHLELRGPRQGVVSGTFLSADTYSLFVVSISVQILLLHLHLLV